MSEIRVDTITSEDGGNAVAFNKGVNVTGVATATTFKGALTGDVTGNVTGNATGVTGTPDITIDGLTANDIQVSGSCTITGNLTVDGDTTTVNTSTLDVSDKTVGIASTTAATNTTAAGSGIEI